MYTDPITIAAYRGRDSGRWTSRLLAWWQRCDWSHVCIVWATDGDKALISEATLRGGVHTGWRHWDAWMYDRWAIQGDATAVRAWWARHEGQRYDWLGLLGFIFRRVKGSSRAAWCSEAVADSLGLIDPWRWDVADVCNHCRMHGLELIRDDARSD